MLGFLSALFWGALVISLLVVSHEAGHFLAARAFGMRVTEFFLGLPSRYRLSWRSRKLGTEFGVTPLLLGGYNRICGMEGIEDELMAPTLAIVQREGRVRVDDIASELGYDVEDAYDACQVLFDWGSIRPYYDPELGEHEGQKYWPAAVETLARDAQGRTAYDRGNELAAEGATAAGEPHPLDGTADEALERERANTYLGKGFWQRLVTLLAGPFVNVLLAVVLVVVALSVIGMPVETEHGVEIWRPSVLKSVRLAFIYAIQVATFASRLVVPTHTVEVLESSSSVVGISVMASEAAQTGIGDLMLLVASVSMSLGFMNLLPIPPLDGGKIVIEIVQLIIGRPVPLRVQNAVSYVGLAFFVFVFVFALRNDLLTYVFG